jgi:transcriptional regulator with XRE-family HTH domain
VSTTLTKALAARLAKLREQRGMSQQDVARKARLQRVSVSRIERGVHEPSLTTLERIAKALGVRLVVDFK